MRIVHLLSGGETAGGQVVALRLARAARDAGHAASFVSPTGGDLLARAEAEGFPTRVLALGRALDVAGALALRGLLRRERADILHTHTHFSLNVLGRLGGRGSGAAVVAHMHIENVFRSGRGRALQIALDDATARLCAAIVAVSASTRAALVRQGYPAARVAVVPNGVELQTAEPAADLPRGAPLLVHVGRLAPVKGQRDLIEALARLRDRSAVAVLVGKDIETDGAYRLELERAARDLGVAERVVFAGYRDDVAAVLAAADVVVLPSRIEGLPLVVLEAMAAGRAVVATRVGGTPELVRDGETGLLVPPADPAALSRALDELVADPARRAQLGAAGRRRAEDEFSVERMCRRVLDVYNGVRG